MEAYGFVELFAGAGWTSRVMRTAGVPTASFDIAYTDAFIKEGKQNTMDFCTSAGFAFHSIAKSTFLVKPKFGYSFQILGTG